MANDQNSATTALAWHQRFVDLDHPNPYIAFGKSAAWATLVFVCVLAVVSSSAVNFLFSLFFPHANGFFVFLVECFGYAAALVSFLLLMVVMAVEARILVGKVWSQGSKTNANDGRNDRVSQ